MVLDLRSETPAWGQQCAPLLPTSPMLQSSVSSPDLSAVTPVTPVTTLPAAVLGMTSTTTPMNTIMTTPLNPATSSSQTKKYTSRITGLISLLARLVNFT